MGEIDHTHASPANYLYNFKAPDLPANKIVPRHCLRKVALIGLDNGIEQGVDFLQITYSLSELILALGILLDKFVYVRLPAGQVRIDEFLKSLLKDIGPIVVSLRAHQDLP
jgi:hypothetical protein